MEFFAGAKTVANGFKSLALSFEKVCIVLAISFMRDVLYLCLDPCEVLWVSGGGL